MPIVKMEKRIIKRIGCVVAILFFLGIPTFFIGELYYYVVLKRNYAKIEEYKTITIWKNCIIFDRYWYPFYPKNNYILINTNDDYYNCSFTITQDSVLGIWSDDSIKIYGMDEFKTIETFKRDEREAWVCKYSFTNTTQPRTDSLLLEFNYLLWFPCALKDGTYTYRTDTGVITKNFD